MTGDCLHAYRITWGVHFMCLDCEHSTFPGSDLAPAGEVGPASLPRPSVVVPPPVFSHRAAQLDRLADFSRHLFGQVGRQ